MNYEKALKQTFQAIDELIRSEKGQNRLKQIRKQNKGDVLIQNQLISDTIGCFASVLLITKNKIYTAQIGDSKIFIANNKKITPLTQNHRPDFFDQNLRIQKAGGQVTQGRINGNLPASRAFGFWAFKQNKSVKWDEQIVICNPEIKSIDRNISDQFLLLACDGIWSTIQQKQTSLIKRIKQSIVFDASNLRQSLEQIVDSLLSESPNPQSNIGTKNMAIILVKFE